MYTNFKIYSHGWKEEINDDKRMKNVTRGSGVEKEVGIMRLL